MGSTEHPSRRSAPRSSARQVEAYERRARRERFMVALAPGLLCVIDESPEAARDGVARIVETAERLLEESDRLWLRDITREAAADARLIAAAPDMLAALELLADDHEHGAPGTVRQGHLRQARAAIAKARGTDA